MSIQAISGLSFKSNNKNKTTNVSTPLRMSNIQMKDTVSFGNTQLDARQTAFKIVKEIFIELTPANPNEYSAIEKETDKFFKAATNIVVKVKDNLATFSKAKLPRNRLKKYELGNTQISAGNRDGEITFHEYTYINDDKFLKTLEINPAKNTVKITVEIPAENPLVKKAEGVFNCKNKSVEMMAKILQYKNSKMNANETLDETILWRTLQTI